MESHRWIVTSEEMGEKLLPYLQGKLSEKFSLKSLKRAVDKNCCHINNHVERFGSTILKSGDLVVFRLDETILYSKKMVFASENILFEDSDILIYNKPFGINSDCPEFLKQIQRNQPYLRLVHRLDRDTTGALIFAKSDFVFEKMQVLFKERTIKKEYLAIVDGILKAEKGTVTNYLGVVQRYQGQSIWGEKQDGLEAITHWQTIQKGRQSTLVRCFPITGRTHQIRVHMNDLGAPILGDYQYGKKFQCSYKPLRCLLHAEKIEFVHPISKVQISVMAPLHDDFIQAKQSVL